MRATAADKADNTNKGARLGPVLVRLWPYIWPRERADLRLRIFGAFALLVLAKLATVAVPYAFKWATDALVALHAGKAARPLPARRAHRLDPALRGLARADGGPDASARRDLRRCRDERRAPSRGRCLRPSPRPVDALSPRAQDRRADPRAGARPQRHRDADAHGHAQRRTDRAGILADPRDHVLPVRLALRRHRRNDHRRLSGLYGVGDQLAHRHPPLDERKRFRRQRQGDRTRCSITRRSSISAPNSARASVTTARWRATSAPA